eukprot:9722030-Alexandrium_andersonii.AAC.1
MDGAPSLAEGATPPGLSDRELSELRMKALFALEHPAPGTCSGLIPEFFEAFFEWAGDPNVDLAPWA